MLTFKTFHITMIPIFVLKIVTRGVMYEKTEIADSRSFIQMNTAEYDSFYIFLLKVYVAIQIPQRTRCCRVLQYAGCKEPRGNFERIFSKVHIFPLLLFTLSICYQHLNLSIRTSQKNFKPLLAK